MVRDLSEARSVGKGDGFPPDSVTASTIAASASDVASRAAGARESPGSPGGSIGLDDGAGIITCTGVSAQPAGCPDEGCCSLIGGGELYGQTAPPPRSSAVAAGWKLR